MTSIAYRNIALYAAMALQISPLHAQQAAPVRPPLAATPQTVNDQAVRIRCLMAAADGTRLYTGARDAAREEALGLLFNCMAKQMPPGWIGRASAQAKAAKHLDAAHALDPAWPLASAITK